MVPLADKDKELNTMTKVTRNVKPTRRPREDYIGALSSYVSTQEAKANNGEKMDKAILNETLNKLKNMTDRLQGVVKKLPDEQKPKTFTAEQVEQISMQAVKNALASLKAS